MGGFDAAVVGGEDGGGWVQGGEPGAEWGEVWHQVGFGEDEAVGDGGLFDGLGLAVELVHGVDGVDDGDDAVEAVMGGGEGVAHEGLQDGGRVGEAGGLDDDAADLAGGDAGLQVLQGADEVAADGAAEAAGVEEDGGVVEGFDEEVVEADLAELVDEDGGVGEVWLFEEVVEEGRFSGAEEAGEYDKGDQVSHRARPG